MAAGVGGSLLERGPEHSARPARWAPAWGVLCPLSGEDVLTDLRSPVLPLCLCLNVNCELSRVCIKGNGA